MKLLLGLATAFCLAVSVLIPPAGAADKGTFATAPTLKDGRKWRIGYLEGGQYPDYEVILKAVVRGLIKLGWMEPMELPADNDPTPGGFWKKLASDAKSKYIEFVPDAYYAAGNFDKTLRPATRDAVLQRLNGKKDIDLMIAMGTWAGQDLATDQHAIPTIVTSSSDPIGSNIVKSADDSGFDHLHAKVEPERYFKQVELFHDIVGFRKLGLVYEDSVEGRTFGGVNAVEKVAADRKFEIVRCHAPFNNVSQQQAEEAVIKCYGEIAAKADAVYVTVHRGINATSLPRALEPMIRAKLPTFSMLGAQEVRQGVLMSISQANYTYVGQFHAETIAKIFNGAKPRALEQRWVAPAKIALNLKTAELIGYDPPVDIMMASDEVFEDITPTGK